MKGLDEALGNLEGACAWRNLQLPMVIFQTFRVRVTLRSGLTGIRGMFAQLPFRELKRAAARFTSIKPQGHK